MAIAQTKASPVQTPARILSAGAPNGKVSATADCCPTVVRFVNLDFLFDNPNLRPLGADAIKPNVIYGFDNATNQDNTPGHSYWEKEPGQRKFPQVESDRDGSAESRDGAVWVSVPTGGRIELNAMFDDDTCINKCSYEVLPSSVAAIAKPYPSAKDPTLRIDGLAESEASIKITCGDKLLGYSHVWCREMATIHVGMGTISVQAGMERDQAGNLLQTDPDAKYSVPDIEKFLNDVFRQALLQVKVTDFGVADLNNIPSSDPTDEPPTAETILARLAAFDDTESSVFDEAEAYRNQADSKNIYKLVSYANQVVGSTEPNNIWFACTNASRMGAIGGVALRGDHEALIFVDDTSPQVGSLPRVNSVVAHELGHLLNLYHIVDEEVSTQLPPHLHDSIRVGSTYDPDDPENLMGVGSNKPRKLRYGQWKALRRM